MGLPREACARDLLLASRAAVHWRSQPGWAVPGIRDAYFSEYIVHLEPVDEARTRLEVIGLGARRRDGFEWSITSRDGWPALPHRVASWRDVTPSPADVADTLAVLLQAVTK